MNKGIFYKIIPPNLFKSVPWRNGLGTTNELIIKYIQGYGNFIWRISIAGVKTDGPFSEFSGYERYLLMLEGNGLDLVHSDGSRRELRDILDVANFSGELRTNATLINGEIKDFNVMSLREKCRTSVEILSGESEIEKDSDELFVYNHEKDSIILIGNNELTLPKQNLFHLIDSGTEKLILKSTDSILIKITYIGK
ncbi:MAG: HutD family protein [Candidatus Delongbacteria bacterium]|nr:HutD family protein [Candidatus Delongbacteria bacterium]